MNELKLRLIIHIKLKLTCLMSGQLLTNTVTELVTSFRSLAFYTDVCSIRLSRFSPFGDERLRDEPKDTFPVGYLKFNRTKNNDTISLS